MASGSGVSSVLSRGGDDNTVMSSEDSSDDHDGGGGGGGGELELGLTLGVGVNNKEAVSASAKAQIFTVKDLDFHSSSSSSSSSSSASTTTLNRANVNANATVGTKRTAADSVASQVIGWPPIRAYRMNSMANQAKSLATEGFNSMAEKNKSKTTVVEKADRSTNNANGNGKVRTSLFVKVNRDGIPIGRKVDLTAHSCYETLAQMLEDMFLQTTTMVNDIRSNIQGGMVAGARRTSKLLDGSSEFVLTYEDKDGDWMLVGDVPWGMFVSSVRRLRIMKTSEATGLAPRSQERNGSRGKLI